MSHWTWFPIKVSTADNVRFVGAAWTRTDHPSSLTNIKLEAAIDRVLAEVTWLP